MTKELKQKFSEFYKKRKSFYESHRDMAEKIGFEDWQKNEMFQYYKKGATEATKELQEELEKWKAEWQEQVQKATDEGFARTLQTMQLTKAKELLKWFVWYFKEGSPNLVPYKHKVEEAEQFLKE